MTQRHPRSTARTAVLLVLATIVGLATAAPPVAAAPAPPATQAAADPTPAQAAARWLAEEARWHTDAFTVPSTTASDVLLAWAATGSEHAAAQRVRDAVVATIATRTGLEGTSRTLLALATYGDDPTDVGGRNLDADLRALLLTDANAGRFKATAAATAPSTSVPLHAWAILALAKTSGGAPPVAGTTLAATQCANGSFPATWANATCGNLEVTALAAQALRAAGATTDAAEAEAWIASVQAADGSFTATNGTSSGLVGLAAQTLRAAGDTAAADLAAGYVTALQLTPSAEVWDHDRGAIAENATRLGAAVTAREIPLGARFTNWRTPTLRAVLALGAPGMTGLTPPPVAEAPPEPVRWHAGACAPDEGVNVVLDLRPLVDRLDVRCALGDQISGWAALANAGYPVGSVRGYPGAAVCQVDGVPAAGYPTCWFDGYWSYYHAPNSEPGTAWTYSSLGYNNRKPALNSVEGSRYVRLSSPNAPPAVGPSFPTPVVTISDGPPAQTPSTDATVTFARDQVESTTTCSLDGAEAVPCASPYALTGLAPGAHTLEVVATTPALKRGTTTREWTVLSADCAAIPQAPTFDIVDSEEDLTFTLADGFPIEHAVLTDLDADPAAATFTAGAVVDLTPHEGQRVRVVARRAGGGCTPTDVFSSVYDVRAAYAPRWNAVAGTAGGPSPAVASNSTAIQGWVTGHSEYTPGPNVATTWKVPSNAYGPVDSSPLVLGDHGTVTLTFGAPITDGDGYDLAVFENGFASGANDFLELGYVEVSSNGTDFAAFSSASRRTATVGGFGTQSPGELGGLAGKDLSGRGTPFDLGLLANRPEVRAGTVDLDRITHVRIRDVHGAGDDPSVDSFGRVVFDPTPTTGSGGFDLMGVAVLNQADVVAPVVEVTDAPSGLTAEDSASVTFTVDDPTATVEQRLDAGDWAPATSPIVLTDLADGDHTVEVRATDAAGNRGDDSASWSVDATAPVVEITDAPPPVTDQDTATIAYSVDDPTATVTYRVNGGDWTATTASPIELVDIDDDAYTVEVRAVDAAGNEGTDTASWTIDVSPPELRILTSPNDPSNSRTGTMTFEVGADAVTVECRATATAAWAPCTSPYTGTVPADGPHVMTVRAADAVGNEMTADALWAVDTVAPAVGILTGPDDPTPSTTATFTYDIEDWTGVTFVDCRIDGGEWAGCQDPIEYTGLAVGDHTFEIRAADRARNEGFDSHTWTIRAPRSANEAWALAAHADFLDREPTAPELAAVVARLGAGTSRATIARELATSDEWLAAIVTRLYVDTLGRQPDASGLAHWTGQLRSGRRTVAQVAASFYASPEYFAGIGGGTADTWVTDLYGTLLERQPDADGLAYWTGQVATRGRSWVALQMFQSLESRRARVTGLYQDLLGRAPDAAGRDFWAGRLTREGDIALARSLAASGEYLARAQVRFP